MPKISFTFLCVLTLFGCSYYVEDDYSSQMELMYDIQTKVQEVRNSPYTGLIFIYEGPFGWSYPEYRFKINLKNGVTAEYMELKSHSGLQARNLWNAGVRTHDEMQEKLEAVRFKVNSKNCPIITLLKNDLWNSVVKFASEFTPSDSKRIILDGGSSFNFYLSDGDYNILKYSVIDEDHPLTIKAFEIIKQLKACQKQIDNKKVIIN